MTTPLKHDLSFRPLIDALIDKTLAGKMEWQETAIEDAFVATVKGIQTFEIRRIPIEKSPNEPATRAPREPRRAAEPSVSIPMEWTAIRLSVRGKDGKILYEFIDDGGDVDADTAAHRLWKLAYRVAKNVDERLGGTLELLESL